MTSDPERLHPAEGDRRDERDQPDEQLLYTPAQAAERLSLKESWLRRKAGLREIPCNRQGKHLRFSAADLQSIVNKGSGAPERRQRGRRRRH
ncbi:helix-turn-helix domain-containing protein [Amycolatopsis sp. NPDC051758]|uniref:helix-turn-helix domain-containing protein n=1 Tax=Amycolatopsis sp. NPDC051758 TaxID=3363935 RepID=UPI0037B99F78